MERKIIYLDDAIDALRYAQHRFTVADEAGGMGTVKWSEDVIYFATAERVLAELPSAQPDYTELKQEFIRMASYIDVLLECSDEQKETLIGFISRLSEYMPWTEKD